MIVRLGILLLTLALGVPGTATGAHPGLDEFVAETAPKVGMRPEALRDLLQRARYQPAIIDAITRPAESKPWHAYRELFVTPTRIADGVAFWNEHESLLDSIAGQFQVDPEYVVAIVGIETNYGRNTGGYRVLDALATLGFYYPRRGEFFRRELVEYLRLAQDESLPVEEITGSYAGAMGIGQFIASSYRAYAVDFDGDGRRDLWRSLPDALASVANYLKVHGWQAGKPTVLVLDEAPGAEGLTERPQAESTLAELKSQGFVFDEGPLQAGDRAGAFQLAGAEGPEYWIALNNFFVIMRYNRSPLYAMAVTQLADAIRRERAAVVPET